MRASDRKAEEGAELRLRTFVSPVIRPRVTGRERRSRAAPFVTEHGERLCWMDQLFGGGIVIPEDVRMGREAPLLWLITGPPGSGKTTLALEICHHLATEPQRVPKGLRMDPKFVKIVRGILGPGVHFKGPEMQKALEEAGIPRRQMTRVEFWCILNQLGYVTRTECKLRSLYLALETPAARILENMKRFGWDTSAVGQLTPELGMRPRGRGPLMWLLGSEHLREIAREDAAGFVDRLGDLWDRTWGEHRCPGVVVIDSLNTFPKVSVRQKVDAIRKGLDRRTWLVLLICEGGEVEHEPWEYLADITTRLDVDQQKEYALRTFEIVKAKNQEHAWGKHRLKIYADPQHTGQETGLARGRVAPYIEHGGLYVFPSVHRLLGASWIGHDYIRSRPVPDVPLPLREMDVLVGAKGGRGRRRRRPGLPGGRCTAFVGQRGLMKSHLAYRWLLGRIDEDDGARGLVISLRDEETAAIATLESISKAEGLKREIRPLMSDARLMILHLWPGYMPPEEFMHNVVVRLRATNPQLCVINGIDHIPARLPLCAALDTFVPALASLLSHHEVTSVFAATEETPGALSTLGLLPMADLVLRFSEVRGVPKQEACLLEGVEQVARVTAERVPAGGIGGRHGYLCRDEDPGRLAFRAPDRRAGDTWTE